MTKHRTGLSSCSQSCHPPEQISWWRQALRYGETFGLISGLTW